MFQIPVRRWPAGLETLEETILRPRPGETVDHVSRSVPHPDEPIISFDFLSGDSVHLRHVQLQRKEGGACGAPPAGWIHRGLHRPPTR